MDLENLPMKFPVEIALNELQNLIFFLRQFSFVIVVLETLAQILGKLKVKRIPSKFLKLFLNSLATRININ